MKLYILLALCALVGVSATGDQVNVAEVVDGDVNVVTGGGPVRPLDIDLEDGEQRNILINILVTQMINFIRHLINNGSNIFNIPVLDPLVVTDNRFNIPAGIINLDIAIKNGLMTGLGGFIVNKSNLRPSDLTFDIDITVPELRISADEYDLLGDLFTAIPLYGKGLAYFELGSWRLFGKFHLKQSEDGKSVLIDSIENPGFELPIIKTKLTGVIGGGDIDNVVNALIDEVFLDYIDRFSGAIARVSGLAIPRALNPILGKLNTWRYLSPFV